MWGWDPTQGEEPKGESAPTLLPSHVVTPPNVPQAEPVPIVVPDVEGLKNQFQKQQTLLAHIKEAIRENDADRTTKEKQMEMYANKLSQIKNRTKNAQRKRTQSPRARSGSRKAPVEKEQTSPASEEQQSKDQSKKLSSKGKMNELKKALEENKLKYEVQTEKASLENRKVESMVEQLRTQVQERSQTINELQRSMDTPPQAQTLPRGKRSKGSISSKSTQTVREKNEAEARISVLEATIVDLEDTLKQQASVIAARTQAVTLLSEDLSKKGKSTVDELEDAKREMRSMQNNFVVIESQLKTDLVEKESRLLSLESKINDLEELNSQLSARNVELESRLSTAPSVEETPARDFLHQTELSSDADDERVRNMQAQIDALTKELDDSNKMMIRLKLEHKNKLKATNKTLDAFKKSSGGANEILPLTAKIEELEATVRKLDAQVIELEEEKAKSNEAVQRVADLENLIKQKESEIVSFEHLVASFESEKITWIQAMEDQNILVDNLNARIQSLEMEHSNLEPFPIPGGNASRHFDASNIDVQEKIDTLVHEKQELLLKLKSLSGVSSTDSLTFEKVDAASLQSETQFHLSLSPNIGDETITQLENSLSDEKEKCKSYEAKISELMSELKSLQSTSEESTKQKSGSVKNRLRKMEKEIADAKKALDAEKDRVRELTEKLEDKESLIRQYTEKGQMEDSDWSKDVLDNFSETQKKCLSLENSLLELTEHCEKLRKENIEVVHQLSEEKVKRKRVEEELQMLVATLPTVQATATALEERINALEAKTADTDLESQIEYCNIVIASKDTDIFNLQNSLAGKTQELDDVTCQLQEILRAINDLRFATAQADENMKSMKLSLQEKDEVINRLTNDIQEESKKRINLENAHIDSNQNQEEIDKLKVDLRQLTKEYNSLLETNRRLGVSMETVLAESAIANKEKEMAIQHIKVLEQSLADAQTGKFNAERLLHETTETLIRERDESLLRADEAEKVLQKTWAERNDLIQSRENILQSLASTENALVQERHEIDVQRNEILKYKNEAANREQELAQLKQELDNKSQELNDKKKELEDLTIKAKKLAANLKKKAQTEKDTAQKLQALETAKNSLQEQMESKQELAEKWTTEGSEKEELIRQNLMVVEENQNLNEQIRKIAAEKKLLEESIDKYQMIVEQNEDLTHTIQNLLEEKREMEESIRQKEIVIEDSQMLYEKLQIIAAEKQKLEESMKRNGIGLEENEALKQQLNLVLAEKENLIQQQETKQEERKKLERKLKALVVERNKFNEKMENLTREKNDVEVSLKDITDKYNEEVAKSNSLQNAYTEANLQLESTIQRLQAMEQTFQLEGQENETLLNERVAMLAEKEALLLRNSESQATIENLLAKQIELNETIGSLSQAMGNREEEVAALKIKVSDLLETINKNEDLINEQRLQYEQSQSETLDSLKREQEAGRQKESYIQELLRQVDEISKDLKEKISLCESLEVKLVNERKLESAKDEELFNSLNKELLFYNEKFSAGEVLRLELEEALAQKEKLISQQNSDIEELKLEINNLRDYVNHCDAKRLDETANLKKHQEEAAMLQNNIQTLQNKYDQERVEKNEVCKQLQQLQESNERRISDLAQTISDLQQLADSLRNEKDALIMQMERREDETRKEFEQFQTTIDSLRLELAEEKISSAEKMEHFTAKTEQQQLASAAPPVEEVKVERKKKKSVTFNTENAEYIKELRERVATLEDMLELQEEGKIFGFQPASLLGTEKVESQREDNIPTFNSNLFGASADDGGDFLSQPSQDVSDPFSEDSLTWDDGWGADAHLEEQHAFSKISPDQEKMAKLESELKTALASNESVQEELRVLQVKYSKVIKKLKEQKVVIDRLHADLKSAKQVSGSGDLDAAIMDELRAEIARLEGKELEAKKELDVIKLERDAWAKKVETLKAVNEQLTDKNEKDAWQAQTNQLRAEIAELQSRLDASQPDDSELSVENRTLKNQIDGLEWRISELTELVEEKEEELVKINEKINMTSTDSGNNVALAIDPEKSTVALPGDSTYVQQLQNEISEVRNALTIAETSVVRVKELEQEMEILAAENDTLQGILNKQKLSENVQKTPVSETTASQLFSYFQSSPTSSLFPDTSASVDDTNFYKQQISDLQQTLVSKEDEITNYCTQSDRFVQESEELKEQLRLKELEIQQLLTTIEHEHDDKLAITEGLREVDMMSEELSRMKKSLHSKESELNEYKQETSALIDEIATLKLSLNDTVARHADDLKTMHEEKFKVERQLEETLTAMRELEAAYKNSKSEIERLLNEDRFRSDSPLEIELANAKKSIENERLKYESILSEKEKELSALRDGLERDCDEERSRQESAIQLLKNQLRELDSEAIRSAEEKDAEIRELMAECTELREMCGIRNSEVERLKLELSTRNQSNDVTEELSNKLTTLSAELNSKDSELARISEELSTARRTLEVREVEIRELNERLKDLELKRDEKLVAEQAVLLEISRLGDLLAQRDREIKDLKEMLETLNSEMVQFRNFEKQVQELQGTQQAPISNVSDINNTERWNAQMTGEVAARLQTDLDSALYMLHQRDVRCEELTFELVQLLEERDTLQLRLSNAIRMIEDMKSQDLGQFIPLSPGVVPSSPVQSDSSHLAEKISELHTMGYARDKNIQDESLQRHRDQMNLLSKGKSPSHVVDI